MKPTLSQRVRYQFDNLMSRGTPALIGMLFLLSLIIVILAGVIISAFRFSQDGAAPMSFWEAAWESLMRTLDSGTMGGDTGTGFRLVMLFVTVGGIFVVSTLIGVLSNGIERQMDHLRKGRSRVLESNHTLILGWSPQIFTILNELMIANENQHRSRIVVLADRDKVEMEDEIRDRVDELGGTRIICRSGSPIDPTDIEIASPHTAKSIVVLPSQESTTPDADVIKSVLAITNHPGRRAGPYHIVTQIQNEKNLKLLQMVGANDNVQAVLTGDLIARIVAQTSRQSGLSIVYTELMNFDGDEIYFKSEPALTGKRYSDALLAYEDSCVMGLRKGETILLNPPMDTGIEAGDQIFALSEDDNTIQLSSLGRPPIDETTICSSETPLKLHPEKCLILGWNRGGLTIVHELDQYVVPGSQVTVVAMAEHVEKQITARSGVLQNQELRIMAGDPTDRDLLGSLRLREYNHIIVLADETIDPQKADAKTFVTLLHLRDIADQEGRSFSIVSEMLDLRNRKLAEATRVDDFIVSDHLASLMMAQLSENADLFDVFTDIFDPQGSEIYLKPVGDYVTAGQPVTFYTVVEAAIRRGQTAIGYRKATEASNADRSYGVHTNPRKSELLTFDSADRIIVIAEN